MAAFDCVAQAFADDHAQASARNTPAAVPSSAHDPQPSNDLSRRLFLYVGEWDSRKDAQTIFIVRGGRVVSPCDSPSKLPDGAVQECSDATMLSNGNFLFACKTDAGEITPEKKVVWALRSWDEPADLGPASTIQPLDDPSAPENPGEQQR